MQLLQNSPVLLEVSAVKGSLFSSVSRGAAERLCGSDLLSLESVELGFDVNWR